MLVVNVACVMSCVFPSPDSCMKQNLEMNVALKCIILHHLNPDTSPFSPVSPRGSLLWSVEEHLSGPDQEENVLEPTVHGR